MTIDYTQPPQLKEPRPRGSWWSRNWKWVVPLGCLTPLLVIGACSAGIAWLVFTSIKTTDAYSDAVERAQSDPAVIEALGAPVKPRWWVTGSINVEGNHGTADFSVPLQGSRKRGTLDVQADRDGGVWTYRVMRVRIDGGPVIDLMAPPGLSPEEPGRTDPAAG